MKQLLRISLTILISGIFSSLPLNAQAPDKLSYQAVIRNANNDPLQNKTVGMQISILQGSVDGTVVFSETHTPETNSNGLISIEIGDGAGSDDLSSIDWGNGPFFIKTETDPDGNSDYTIIGTSQLLSVPFALHAKTAESANETDPKFTEWDKTTGISISENQITDLKSYLTTESDPVYKTSQAVNISASDITNLSNLSGVNTGDQNLAQVAAISNSVNAQLKNVTNPTNAQDAATKAYVDLLENAIEEKLYALSIRIEGVEDGPAQIGDLRAGGVVFWVNPNDNRHGLVCTLTDEYALWGCAFNNVEGAHRTAIGEGKLNTIDIVTNCESTNCAAKYCYNLTLNGYSDWFLPSKDELFQMYRNKSILNSVFTANGGAAFLEDHWYYSSSEVDNNNVWLQYFRTGQQNTGPKSTGRRYRPVRAF